MEEMVLGTNHERRMYEMRYRVFRCHVCGFSERETREPARSSLLPGWIQLGGVLFCSGHNVSVLVDGEPFRININ